MIDRDAPDAEEKPSGEDADTAILRRAHEDWQRCEDYWKDNRLEYEADVRFARLGEQWDPKALQRRKNRPSLVINKLPPFIRQVVNDARQNKPAIKALPQDSSADPKTAEIISGLIRNIESASDADVAYDTALECAATGGYGFFRINTAYAHDESWDKDIVFERIANPLMVYGDPDSQAADSSDWNICFVAEMVPRKEYKKRFPGAAVDDFEIDDMWAPGWLENDHVRIAEYWVREQVQKPIVMLSNGQVVDLEAYQTNIVDYQSKGIFPQGEPRDVLCYEVTQYIVSGREVLKKQDWAGKFIPIVPVFGEEVNLNGKRIFRSLIRDAKDAQVLYNVSRSSSAEFVALAPKAPWIGPKGAFDHDQAKWETANVENHPFIEFNGPQAPQRLGMPTAATGPLQEALTSSDEMKSIIGIYDAGMGSRSNETSGRAIIARQRESDTSTFHFIDNLSRAIRHAGRIIIDLIPKVYSAGRVLRILGEDGSVQNVPTGPQAQPAGVDAQGNRIEAIYALGTGRYDLTVSVGPGFNSRREEAATQMIELIRAYPAAAPIIGDLLVKNLDWPGADEIAGRLQRAMGAQQQGGQPQPEQPDPAAMMQAQTAQMQTQIDAQQNAEKLRIDMFNAETARLKAVHEIQQPTRLPMPARADTNGF